MAARKKSHGPAHSPAVRSKAVARVLELEAAGFTRGVQSRVARELKIPASAITYWMQAHRTQAQKAPQPSNGAPNGNGANGHAAASSPARALGEALAAFLEPVIEAKIDASLARRYERLTRTDIP